MKRMLMKLIVASISSSLLVIVMARPIFADTATEVKSNVGITFKEDDSTLEPPKSKPGEPTTSNGIVTNSKEKQTVNDWHLPSTGATGLDWIVVIGIVVIVGTSIALYTRKK